MKQITTFVLVLAALAIASISSATQFAASVSTFKGDCSVVRSGKSRRVHSGMHLFVGDVLVTGPDSAMGVVFNDDTVMSLGPDSEIAIDEFLFEPAGDRFDFAATMARGTAQFITGQMAKLNPESMSVRTPMSTIGIRGTRFLVKVAEE